MVCLVGNQKDRESEREVAYEKGAKFYKDKGLDYFVEASAKTSENVEKAFIMMAKMLYKKH